MRDRHNALEECTVPHSHSFYSFSSVYPSSKGLTSVPGVRLLAEKYDGVDGVRTTVRWLFQTTKLGCKPSLRITEKAITADCIVNCCKEYRAFEEASFVVASCLLLRQLRKLVCFIIPMVMAINQGVLMVLPNNPFQLILWGNSVRV